EFIDRLAGRRTITVMFTNPYVMDNLPIERSSSIILGYQNDHFMQKAALKVLLGQTKVQGGLPVSVNKRFPYGDGISISRIHLGYCHLKDSFVKLNFWQWLKNKSPFLICLRSVSGRRARILLVRCALHNAF